ncbi:MAG: hypothetical protein LBC51_06590 [Treponema sp.]|nr:hypothetical protein [Treponema sp.]
MKKKHGVFLGFAVLTIAAIFTVAGCDSGGGGGSNLIRISTAAQFNAIRNRLDGHYVLEADIDLSGYTNWEPIGQFEALSEAESETPNPAKVFSGTFDGNGHTISNITINQPQLYVGVGLFGVNFGSIRNLTVKNVDVTGYYLAGGVVGMQGGTLENITLNGTNTIRGSQGIGGIVGVNFGAISNCAARANIVVSNDPAYPLQSPYNGNSGGILLGGMEGGSIANCIVNGGSVTAASVADCWGLGGLAGNVYNGPSVINCRAENITVTASGTNNSRVGGLVGFTGTFEGDPTSVSGCGVSNVIIAVSDTTTQVGGLIGGNWINTDDSQEDHLPSRYHISSCTVNGCTITGGTESVGSIAGYAYNSIIENSTATNATWNGGTINQIGKADNGSWGFLKLTYQCLTPLSDPYPTIKGAVASCGCPASA